MNVMIEQVRPAEKNRGFEESESSSMYPPAAYHKMLDYRIAEILLSVSVVGGIILFISRHH